MKAVRSTTKLSLICSLALIVLNSTFGFITQGRTFCSSQLGAVRDATSSTKSGSLTRRTPVRYAISNRITDEEMQAEKDGGGRVPNKRQLSSQLRAKVKELYKQAEAAAARGQAGSARALLTEGVGLDPRDGHSWLALARLEQGLGRHATARQVFAEGVEQCPANVHLWQAWAVMEARLNQVAAGGGLLAAGALALDRGTRACATPGGCWRARRA
ncbi:unnamed protein product, partial [Heterosigma akashiwo]